jgi:hypothetical protein
MEVVPGADDTSWQACQIRVSILIVLAATVRDQDHKKQRKKHVP